MEKKRQSSRTTFIKVRVTKDERVAFTNRARELGVTVSDLIRQAAFCPVTVRAIDSDAAFELRRMGAMLKSLYPRNANWSAEEKRRCWRSMETILGFAEKLVKKNPS